MPNIQTYFSASLLGIALCIGAQSQPMKDVSEASPKVKTVSYCDLVRKFKSYDGEVVRLKAQLYTGSDWSIGDRPCETRETIAAVNFLCKDEEECREMWKPLEAIIPWDKMRDLPPRGAEVVVVGRFHGPRRGGYGHIGIWNYLLEVVRVESAAPVIDRPEGVKKN